MAQSDEVDRNGSLYLLRAFIVNGFYRSDYLFFVYIIHGKHKNPIGKQETLLSINLDDKK